MIKPLIFKPADLGINAADLQADAATKYPAVPAPLGVMGAFRFNFVGQITNVGGGAAGEAKVTISSVDDEGTILKTLDILATIPTNTVGSTTVDFTFGGGGAGKSQGVGALDSDNAMFEVVYDLQVNVEVVTANNGTSAVMSAWLIGFK